MWLQADKTWETFIGQDGPLQLLVDEQQDVLVGPRPQKPPPMTQSSFGGQSNGNVLPEQLIKFLQSMNLTGSRFV